MTLYLHIGAQKTGTTTIQAALAHSRDRLRAVGLTYPEVEPEDTNKVSHYNSLRGFFTRQSDQIASTQAFMRRVNAISGDVLLSAEALSNWPLFKPDQGADAYWIAKQRILVRMREEIRDPDVKVIFCIRERRSYLKSLFKQHLKVLDRPSTSIEDELRGFLRREVVRSDMERQVRVWQKVFGEVRVIRFEDHAKDGSLLAAFMRQIDRDLVLEDVERRNVSPDWTDLEMLRVRRTMGLPPATRKDPAPAPDARNRFNDMIEHLVRQMIDAAMPVEPAATGQAAAAAP